MIRINSGLSSGLLALHYNNILHLQTIARSWSLNDYQGYYSSPAVKKPKACHVLCHSGSRSLLHRSIAGVDVDHRCGWRALIAALRLYRT